MSAPNMSTCPSLEKKQVRTVQLKCKLPTHLQCNAKILVSIRVDASFKTDITFIETGVTKQYGRHHVISLTFAA